MSNNTTEIKISRSATPYSSRSNAIIALDSYNFHPGELVAVTYNVTDEDLNVIFAVGIEDGGYKIVSLLQNRVVKGVLSSEPRTDKKDYLWTNGENWFLGEDPLSQFPGIIINDANTQTYYTVSLDGQTPRQINNVYNREELIERTSTIISKIVQSDWTERNMLAPSYVRNKPDNLSNFEEDIRYSLVQVPSSDPSFLNYALQKTKGASNPEIVGDIITIPYDSSLISGTVEIVTPEDKQPGGKFYEEDSYEVGDHYLDFIIEIGLETYTHVYILVKSLTDIYTAGLGINIEDYNISFQIIEQNGLRVDAEKGLTIDPVSNTSPGSMNPSMKQKIDSINEEEYAMVSDITEGIIEPKVSKTSLNIEPPPYDYRIFESPGFIMRPCNGIDTGNGEILKLGGGPLVYDEKNQPLFCYPKLTSIGNNSCDPKKMIPSYKIDSSGVIVRDNTKSIAYLNCFYTPYSIFSQVDNNIVVGYSESELSISESMSSSVLILEKDEHGHYNPPRSGFLYISTNLLDISSLCVRISGDGTMDNVFEPYTETIVDMGNWENKPDYIGNYILEGDSINNVDGELFCTKKWGDISIEEWGTRESEVEIVDNVSVTRYFYRYDFDSDHPEKLLKPETENYFVFEYNYNSGSKTWRKTDVEIITTNTGFKYYVPTSSTTVLTLRIIYELNQYLTFNIDTSPIYPVYKYGTEILSYPTPSNITTRYKPNLLNDLIQIRTELKKKISVHSVDDQMSNASKNPVQCKVVKKYIDSIISSYSTSDLGDLSKQDFYGGPKLMNTANCYIITKYTTNSSNTYKFPLVYGNAIKNGEDNKKSYNSFVDYLGNNITSPWIDSSYIGSAGVLWKDPSCSIVPSSVSIITVDRNKYISFTTSTENNVTRNGNAVIYLKDSQGRIVWTWHIWEQNPNSTLKVSQLFNPISIWNRIPENGPTSGTEYKIMPVYLGFTMDGTSGVYYQWGRKDPFSLNSSPVIIHTKSSTSNAIQNPQTLFLDTNTWNSSGNILNYWNYNSAAPNSFGDYNTGKTIYDPSPAGWKVPNSNVFRGFTTTGTQTGEGNIKGSYRPGLSNPALCGYDFKHSYEDNTPSISYPLFQAIGYLDGTLKNTETHGYYWSAVQGCSLEFSDSVINPVKSGTNLSLGFPIHPILE